MLSMAIAMLAHPQPANFIISNNSQLLTPSLSFSQEDDILSISTTDNRIIEYIEIFNSSNLLKIESEGCSESTCQVDINTLSSGTYLCRVTTPYGTCSETFVK
jgi:hypothetical protein